MNIARCGKCGMELNKANEIQPDQTTPCPSCGSTSKQFDIPHQEGIIAGDENGIKAKHNKGEKPFIEQISGSELNHGTGRFVNKFRVIDRDNDIYVEIIRDLDTGKAIRCSIELLSDHINHGYAKFHKPM